MFLFGFVNPSKFAITDELNISRPAGYPGFSKTRGYPGFPCKTQGYPGFPRTLFILTAIYYILLYSFVYLCVQVLGPLPRTILHNFGAHSNYWFNSVEFIIFYKLSVTLYSNINNILRWDLVSMNSVICEEKTLGCTMCNKISEICPRIPGRTGGRVLRACAL